MRKSNRVLLATSTTLALAACGGGGGGGGSGLVSTPPPPPPPSGSTAVDIFPSPSTQQFVDFGTGTDLDIRYNSATGVYEITAGPLPWTKLVDDVGSSQPLGSPNQNFALDSAAQNQSYFMIRAHYASEASDHRYSYSNIATWGASAAVTGSTSIAGLSAFGIPTPAGAVPVTGSASYQGFIEGHSTVEYQYDSYLVRRTSGAQCRWNSILAADPGGCSSLILHVPELHAAHADLLNTVFGVGNTNFSGMFATGLAGPNSFSGQFTGPNAQELIGHWAFPFLSPIDGALESAEGVWIAKRP